MITKFTISHFAGAMLMVFSALAIVAPQSTYDVVWGIVGAAVGIGIVIHEELK